MGLSLPVSIVIVIESGPPQVEHQPVAISRVIYSPLFMTPRLFGQALSHWSLQVGTKLDLLVIMSPFCPPGEHGGWSSDGTPRSHPGQQHRRCRPPRVCRPQVCYSALAAHLLPALQLSLLEPPAGTPLPGAAALWPAANFKGFLPITGQLLSTCCCTSMSSWRVSGCLLPQPGAASWSSLRPLPSKAMSQLVASH